MEISRKPPTGKGPAETFTGEVWVDPPGAVVDHPGGGGQRHARLVGDVLQRHPRSGPGPVLAHRPSFVLVGAGLTRFAGVA